MGAWDTSVRGRAAWLPFFQAARDRDEGGPEDAATPWRDVFWPFVSPVQAYNKMPSC